MSTVSLWEVVAQPMRPGVPEDPRTSDPPRNPTDTALRTALLRGGGPTIKRIAARTGNGLVFLSLDEVLAFEAKERLQFVHSSLGRFDVDVSLDELEKTLGDAFVRAHRNWLVSIGTVRKFETTAGLSCLELEGTREYARTVLRVPYRGSYALR